MRKTRSQTHRRSRGFSCSSGQLFLFRDCERSASRLEGSLTRKWLRGDAGRSARPEAEGEKKGAEGGPGTARGGCLRTGPRSQRRCSEALWSFIPQRCSDKGRHSSPRSGHQGDKKGAGETAARPLHLAKMVLGSCDLPFQLFWEVILGRTEGRREPTGKCQQGYFVFLVNELEGTGKGAAKRTSRFPRKRAWSFPLGVFPFLPGKSGKRSQTFSRSLRIQSLVLSFEWQIQPCLLGWEAEDSPVKSRMPCKEHGRWL